MSLPLERQEFTGPPLNKEDLAESPIEQLRQWIAQAVEVDLPEPCAMNVATVGPDGRPSSRMVLLRGLDENGLTFFTNYHSRKGMEISSNPHVSLCFYWPDLFRQVRVEGRIVSASGAESDAYFHSRPRDSQLVSAASHQSQVIDSREKLEAEIDELEARFPGEVERPDHWGGYRIVPDRFEFWQGRPARLHDRLVYRRAADRWVVERLAP